MFNFKSMFRIAGINKNDLKLIQATELEIFKEEPYYIVYSPVLDLSGYGRSLQSARRSYTITLKETLLYCVENGTLKNILRVIRGK